MPADTWCLLLENGMIAIARAPLINPELLILNDITELKICYLRQCKLADATYPTLMTLTIDVNTDRLRLRDPRN